MKILRILVAMGMLALVGRANGQALTNLYSFTKSPVNQSGSHAALVQGSDSNFYGTTTGYPWNLLGSSVGTVFRISPKGSYTNLHFFTTAYPYDGAYPFASLIQGSNGYFYGTTQLGGTYVSGIVFRISSNGSYTNLYSFGSYLNDGAQPLSGLVQGSDGYFYGTTWQGGTYNSGTVFRISSNGSYTNLYSFGGYATDGAEPLSGLVQGSDGNFYGTTSEGGTHNTGTVFRISSDGSYTNLYSFGNSLADGNKPNKLLQGSDGNFYGTTWQGGTNACACGTLFRISPSGIETNLYTFGNLPNEGKNPNAGLVQGSDGNFYGTTWYGGNTNLDDTYMYYGYGTGYGTIFRISPSGIETTLYIFGDSPTDGAQPNQLVQGIDGNFYGTTWTLGTNDSGTVFRFSIPLNPPPWPINQITEVQPSGTNVVFNVVSIAGETYQLQFSPSMNPTNWVNVPNVSVTNSIGAMLTLTNFGGASGPQGFYRFAITP